MTVRLVAVPGAHLVVESGGDDGIPLVLLHAGVADRRMWVPVIADLPGHRVVRCDLRGFGASPPPTARLRHTDDLHTVLDALGIGRLHLAGSSHGGRVAMAFAVRHPDRVSGLALFAPPLPGGAKSTTMRDYGAAEDAALGAHDIDTAVSVNLHMWVRGTRRRWTAALRAIADTVTEPLRVALVNRQAVDVHEDTRVPDLRGALPGLAVPTVVAVGTADVPDFVEHAGHIAGTVRHARLVRIPDTGHLIPPEHPAGTAKVLLDITRP